jgi:monofunctional biosynthetic peptidoglycan transglycosylase
MTSRHKTLIQKIWFFLKYFILGFLIVSILSVIIYRFVPISFTPLMLQRSIERKSEGKKGHIKHQWVPLSRISPNMVLAAIAAEDNNFTSHFGIDEEALKKAYEHNKNARHLRGASTITQQTCKNVYLWLGRNYIRKGLELYYTFWVEIIWGKRRIMEVYLNSIEMGDGIFGIEAAAQTYFNKPASRLTASEAALIAAAFPNPRKRNPANPSAYLIHRQQDILWVMEKLGRIEL